MILSDLDFSKLPDLLVYHREAPLLFSSGLFLFLFLAFSVIYGLVNKNNTAKFLFVTLFSFYFYYKSSGICFLLLLLTSVVDYTMGLLIYNSRKRWQRRLFLTISITFSLSLLGYFKYTNFLYDIFCQFAHQPFRAFDIILPVGISFFTFQSLSYTIDIYRGVIQPLRRWLDFAFFVSFFPQLVAGPIVRARDFIPQMYKRPVVTKEMFGSAIFLIAIGLFKKTVISDYISINFVDRIFDNPSLYSGLEILLSVYGYALQIYCDFSGYSDMAIGIALLLGFHFNINFNSPYKSLNITEFWRRWHISLSTWLRDYLYISLGGNRKGKIRTYINLFLTMLIGGLWHGAAFRFILWGAIHGAALIIHKLYRAVIPSKGGVGPVKRFFALLLTFHIVVFAWVPFRADNMEIVRQIFGRIFTNFHPELFFQVLSGYALVMSLIVLGYLLHFFPERWETGIRERVVSLPLVAQAVVLTFVILIVFQFKSSAVQPFIYFQF
jgi:D-alanyl-lipoteichoic acid acyltransferase DltB (MBOAT superfamily)